MTSEDCYNDWQRRLSVVEYNNLGKRNYFFAGHASRDPEVAELKRQLEVVTEERDRACKEIESKWRTAFKSLESKGGKE